MLGNLPKTCQFNVTLFGSDNIELFPFALKNSETNIQKAVEWINTLQSNFKRGNTDLLKVIQSSLLFNDDNMSRKIDFDYAAIQNFILISDGHVSRSNELFTTLRSLNAKKSGKVLNRIFTCGVGLSANNHTLKLIARLTGGGYESFDSNLNWLDKSIDIMDKVAQPAAIQDMKVEWQNMDQADTYEKVDSGMGIF